MDVLRRAVFALFIAFVCMVFWDRQSVFAHCQIPCGIYGDRLRVELMLEDAATIEKACRMIAALAQKTDAQSKHQLARWIQNKEKHAQNIIVAIGDYFLTQRVKPTQKDYIQRLKRHHAVILAAMKAKQSAKNIKVLRDRILALRAYYPK